MSEDIMVEGAAAGAIAGIFATLGIFLLVFYILVVIAEWKIFLKAGEAGWKALIPIYNLYIAYKIVGMHVGWFCALIILGIAAGAAGEGSVLTSIYGIFMIVLNVYYAIKLGNAFNKGTGFKVGLVLLPNIFQLILGFGSAEYDESKALNNQ